MELNVLTIVLTADETSCYLNANQVCAVRFQSAYRVTLLIHPQRHSGLRPGYFDTVSVPLVCSLTGTCGPHNAIVVEACRYRSRLEIKNARLLLSSSCFSSRLSSLPEICMYLWAFHVRTRQNGYSYLYQGSLDQKHVSTFHLRCYAEAVFRSSCSHYTAQCRSNGDP